MHLNLALVHTKLVLTAKYFLLWDLSHMLGIELSAVQEQVQQSTKV
jgi:hypothetical protein